MYSAQFRLTEVILGSHPCFSAGLALPSLVLCDHSEQVLVVLLEILDGEGQLREGVLGDLGEAGAVLVLGLQDVGSDGASAVRVGCRPS